MKQILILDCNYICHAAGHSMPNLSFHGYNTGIVFGFLKRLIRMADQFKADNVVFTWDSKWSIRRKIYPDYKKQRIKAAKVESAEERERKRITYEQIDLIRDDVLPNIGFINIVQQHGYEADDLMASVVNSNEDNEFVVATTDKDLYQIISDRCRIHNPSTGITRTVEFLKKEHNCTPDMWGEALAIAGCRTDNVKGVSGVGMKTAIKYLNGELKHNSKKFKDIQSSTDTITENRELVKLPMAFTEPISINKNHVSTMNFVKVCEKYGLRSILTDEVFLILNSLD